MHVQFSWLCCDVLQNYLPLNLASFCFQALTQKPFDQGPWKFMQVLLMTLGSALFVYLSIHPLQNYPHFELGNFSISMLHLKKLFDLGTWNFIKVLLEIFWCQQARFINSSVTHGFRKKKKRWFWPNHCRKYIFLARPFSAKTWDIAIALALLVLSLTSLLLSCKNCDSV